MTQAFPGATAVSRLRVYDWPTVDGLRGGSPHLHTVSAEGYVVLGGRGAVQTLSGEGYDEHPLSAGVMLWFTPGTVHRLINEGDLDILVVMQNAGLPEAGDAVLTFPPEVLDDPAAYAAAAALPDAGAGEPTVAAAALARRNLAIEGFLDLRERVFADGPGTLKDLYAAAAALVGGRTGEWRPPVARRRAGPGRGDRSAAAGARRRSGRAPGRVGRAPGRRRAPAVAVRHVRPTAGVAPRRGHRDLRVRRLRPKRLRLRLTGRPG